MEFVDGLIVHLWSGVLLVVHAKHNRADAGFQRDTYSLTDLYDGGLVALLLTSCMSNTEYKKQDEIVRLFLPRSSKALKR